MTFVRIASPVALLTALAIDGCFRPSASAPQAEPSTAEATRSSESTTPPGDAGPAPSAQADPASSDTQLPELTCAQDRERQPAGQRSQTSRERPQVAVNWPRAAQQSTQSQYQSPLNHAQQRLLGKAAAHDFAAYMVQVHQRVHPHFAGDLFSHLDDLPCTDPLNDYQLTVELELVLSAADGHLTEVGVVRTSGVDRFDELALEVVLSADPFGAPPPSIVSSDGNVYVRWELRRHPVMACSPYAVMPCLF